VKNIYGGYSEATFFSQYNRSGNCECEQIYELFIVEVKHIQYMASSKTLYLYCNVIYTCLNSMLMMDEIFVVLLFIKSTYIKNKNVFFST
jgi:hypothetical protein